MVAPPPVTVFGILNVTPDSFSDGGRFVELAEAVERGVRLHEEGASFVDVGGESTRPGAAEVAVAEELRRVVTVVAALAARGVPVSVDTRKAAVARAAVAEGASVVNDVTGFADPAMVEVVAAAGVGAVTMHMRGTPSTMRGLTAYEDVVGEVALELQGSVARLRAAGVRQVWADPGLGFAKTAAQSRALLRGLPRLGAGVGAPVLVGASRKSFLQGFGPGTDTPAGRLPGSLVAAVAAVAGGASAVRVHDVAATVQALAAWAALAPEPA